MSNEWLPPDTTAADSRIQSSPALVHEEILPWAPWRTSPAPWRTVQGLSWVPQQFLHPFLHRRKPFDFGLGLSHELSWKSGWDSLLSQCCLWQSNIPCKDWWLSLLIWHQIPPLKCHYVHPLGVNGLQSSSKHKVKHEVCRTFCIIIIILK